MKHSSCVQCLSGMQNKRLLMLKSIHTIIRFFIFTFFWWLLTSSFNVANIKRSSSLRIFMPVFLFFLCFILFKIYQASKGTWAKKIFWNILWARETILRSQHSFWLPNWLLGDHEEMTVKELVALCLSNNFSKTFTAVKKLFALPSDQLNSTNKGTSHLSKNGAVWLPLTEPHVTTVDWSLRTKQITINYIPLHLLCSLRALLF